MKTKLGAKLTCILSIFFITGAYSDNSEIFLEPMVLAQRHCPDVYFTPGTVEVKNVVCTWMTVDKDSTMSLTTHFQDPSIDHVKGSCIFKPAAGSNDTLMSIREAKAAKISTVNINGNQSTFILRVSGEGNANILFYLHRWWLNWAFDSYTAGDEISCDFSVVRK